MSKNLNNNIHYRPFFFLFNHKNSTGKRDLLSYVQTEHEKEKLLSLNLQQLQLPTELA